MAIPLFIALLAVACGLLLAMNLDFSNRDTDNSGEAKPEGAFESGTLPTGDEGFTDDNAEGQIESPSVEDENSTVDGAQDQEPDKSESEEPAYVASEEELSHQPKSNVTGEFAQMLRDGQVHSIRVIGDSLTAGWDTDSTEDSSDSKLIVYQDDQETKYETPYDAVSWTNIFRKYAKHKGVEQFVSAGVGGYKMSQLKENPESWIREGADVIVVMLGTNDADYSDKDQFERDARAALAEVSQHCKHMVVVSPPINHGTLIPNKCEIYEIDDVLNEICVEKEWEQVSLYNAIDPDDPSQVHRDHVHPKAKGAELLFNTFRHELRLPE